MTSPSASASHDDLSRVGAQFEATSYEIIGLIGEGAMGTVYLGRHRRLRRRVAVKVLKAHLGGEIKDRFRLEAQASASLRHDNIVDVIDCGSLPDTSPYLVMELLEGVSLSRYIDDSGGYVPVERACDIARQILAAIGYAHDRGIIHRDIKPANIHVSEPGGRIKLVDFGVAKITAALTDVAPARARTAEGAAVGTPRYMAPEQARGGQIDGRADLYAVGVVLYQMLTGEPPFAALGKMSELLVAKCTRMPPPPSSMARQPIPRRLDEVVLRAMALDPALRFKDAYAMAGAIIELSASYREIAAQLGLDEVEWEQAGPATAPTVPGAPPAALAGGLSPSPHPPALAEPRAPRLGKAAAGALGIAATLLSEQAAAELGRSDREERQDAALPRRAPPWWRDGVDAMALGFALALALGILARMV